MATINKNTIINNGFTVGLNVPSALGLDGGADGSYIIAANQIAWGNNSTFNGKKFGNTTAELLTTIEEAIEDKKSEATGNITGVTVKNTGNILSWGKSVAVANVNGTDIKVQLPANPDTNTDTKVTSVGNHYTAKEITTQALYKIKTDAAGHIISATKFDDFIEKSVVNNLKQQIADFKLYMIGLSSSTSSSSTPTVTPTVTVTPTGDSSVSPTPTPKPDTTTPTTTPAAVTPLPDTTTPTTTLVTGVTTLPGGSDNMDLNVDQTYTYSWNANGKRWKYDISGDAVSCESFSNGSITIKGKSAGQSTVMIWTDSQYEYESYSFVVIVKGSTTTAEPTTSPTTVEPSTPTTSPVTAVTSTIGELNNMDLNVGETYTYTWNANGKPWKYEISGDAVSCESFSNGSITIKGKSAGMSTVMMWVTQQDKYEYESHSFVVIVKGTTTEPTTTLTTVEPSTVSPTSTSQK